MMTRILCYGDSNTWGFRPDSPFTRFPKDTRWTGVLDTLLGEQHEIIEEGLNGRTTVWDDPFGDHKNGMMYLPPCLESHAELDLVIIMLGTNDLKAHFDLTAADAAQGVKALVAKVRSSGAGPGGSAPNVLAVAPPPLGKLSLLAGVYGDAPEKSKDLGHQIGLIAEFINCPFMDAGSIVTSSDIDGVHWEADQHTLFAGAVAERIKSIFPG
jgi:lysophospholipase L1-like esterase